MTIWTCPYCGANNARGNCACGAVNLSMPPPTNKVDAWVCGNCCAINPGTNFICGTCGKPLPLVTVDAPSPAPQSPVSVVDPQIAELQKQVAALVATVKVLRTHTEIPERFFGEGCYNRQGEITAENKWFFREEKHGLVDVHPSVFGGTDEENRKSYKEYWNGLSAEDKKGLNKVWHRPEDWEPK